MEILLKLNTKGMPDPVALEQLFAWAHRVENPENGNGAISTDLDDDDRAEDIDQPEELARPPAGQAEIPATAKRRGRISNAEKARLAAEAAKPVILPPGYVPPAAQAPTPAAAPQSFALTGVTVIQTGTPPVAAAVPPGAAAPPAAAPPVQAFPNAQPAAMPAIPPAGAAASDGQPTLEDLRTVCLQADKAVRAGIAFGILKQYSVYTVEKLPPDKRLEVIEKLYAAINAPTPKA